MSKKEKNRTAQAPRREDVGAVARKYAAQLCSPRTTDRFSLLSRLKYESPAVVRATFKIASAAIATSTFVGGPFPKHYRDLFQTSRTTFTGLLSNELRWVSMTLYPFAQQIARFLEKKTAFESAFLVGRYDDARQILNNVTQAHGTSLWSVDAHLLLAEYSGGLAANREFLQTLKSQVTNTLVSVFAQFYSERAEIGTSYTNFDLAFESFYRSLAKVDGIHAQLENIRFYAHAATFADMSVLPYVLWRTGGLPVIDRYDTYVRCLQLLAAFRPADRSLVSECVTRDALGINDPRLELLSRYTAPRVAVPVRNNLPQIYSALDAYTVGDYASAKALALEGIIARPDVFELYEAYANSVANEGSDIANPLSPETLSGQILEHMLNVASRNDRTPDSAESLLTISSALSSARLGAQLLGFVRSTLVPNSSADLLANLNSTVPTPRFSLQFAEPSDANDYLGVLRDRFGDTPTIRLFASLRGGSPNGPLAHLPPPRRLKYEALAQRSVKNFDAAIESYRSIWQMPTTAPAPRVAAVTGLFDCYLSAGRLDECVALVVDVHLSQPHVLLGIPLSSLVDAGLRQGAVRSDPLSWAILYQLQYSQAVRVRDTEQLNVFVDEFLRQLGIARPSNVRGCHVELPLKKLVYFLQNICVLDVLDHSIEYASTDDIENERIAICQLLLELDEQNAGAYSEEIFRLVQTGLVRKALQHLEKSKVSIDVRGIIQSLDKSFRERYERYSSFLKLSDRQREAFRVSGIDLPNEKNLIILTDASRVQFEELFSDLKARFISSNEHGLDSYLSVRIRHGTLSGQIRSQFERENLITRRNALDGVYDQNSYWRERVFQNYGLDAEVAAIQLLRDFSQRVDSIIETVKDRWIQVKGSANENQGLFDYEYSEEDVAQLYVRTISAESYDDFLDTIFGELWDRTGKNLDRVVTRIRTDLSYQLTSALDALASQLFALHEDIRHSPFNESMIRCRTRIQNEIEAIAAWFRIPNETSLGDFAARVLVETAVATVNKCFPTYSFSPRVTVEPDIMFKGSALVPLGDVMFILLGNVVKHSRVDDIDASINICGLPDRVVFTVENSLGVDVNVAEVQSKTQVIHALKDAGALSGATRKEGGSGYHKLHKLLRYDLKCRDVYSVKTFVSRDSDAASARFTVSIVIPREGIVT